MLPLILASSSITRKELLARLQISFKCLSPNVDESPLLNERPEDLALRLAKAKAEIIAKKHPDALIISADQVILCGDIRLDKPGTFENAVIQLETVSGKQIESYTALCLLNSKTGHIQTGIETYQVAFRELSRPIIEDYIKRDQPLHCAGSIKAEGLGITLFTRMTGRDPTALLGLPLMLLTDMLVKENVFLLG